MVVRGRCWENIPIYTQRHAQQTCHDITKVLIVKWVGGHCSMHWDLKRGCGLWLALRDLMDKDSLREGKFVLEMHARMVGKAGLLSGWDLQSWEVGSWKP